MAFTKHTTNLISAIFSTYNEKPSIFQEERCGWEDAKGLDVFVGCIPNRDFPVG